MKIMIDGVEYVPVTKAMGGDYTEAMRLLAQVYGVLWTESYYDPYNESTKNFAIPLSEKMERANAILRFKP
jgi:hypothetical protein